MHFNLFVQYFILRMGKQIQYIARYLYEPPQHRLKINVSLDAIQTLIYTIIRIGIPRYIHTIFPLTALKPFNREFNCLLIIVVRLNG